MVEFCGAEPGNRPCTQDRPGERSNVVTVYKLIAKGTIEENIVKLQEKKMALADQIIAGEEMGSGSFSKEELLELLKEL